MATRLILDELDLNLPALAARLVVVIVVVVGSRARALGAAIDIGGVEGAVAVVVELRRRVLVVFSDLAGHGVARVSLVAGVWPWAVLTAFGRGDPRRLFGGEELRVTGQGNSRWFSAAVTWLESG